MQQHIQWAFGTRNDHAFHLSAAEVQRSRCSQVLTACVPFGSSVCPAFKGPQMSFCLFMYVVQYGTHITHDSDPYPLPLSEQSVARLMNLYPKYCLRCQRDSGG